jgi:hypothetical protein
VLCCTVGVLQITAVQQIFGFETGELHDDDDDNDLGESHSSSGVVT